MDGYRASLITVLPELDTYGVLPKFARNPDDPQLLSSYIALLARARKRIRWDLHDMLGSHIDVADRVALRIGSRLGEHVHGDRKTLTTDDFAHMTDQQAKDVYMTLLKQTGMMHAVDPDGSMNKGNQGK